jgi:hypothetical protein
MKYDEIINFEDKPDNPCLCSHGYYHKIHYQYPDYDNISYYNCEECGVRYHVKDKMYLYQGQEYTPEQFARLVKLKAFI